MPDEPMNSVPTPVIEQPEEPTITVQSASKPLATVTTLTPEPEPIPTFQERLDGVRDAFRSTYQTHGVSKTGVADAKAEMDKAKTTYDDAMSDAAASRREHLEDTRDLIRVLQEHESNLVAEVAA